MRRLKSRPSLLAVNLALLGVLCAATLMHGTSSGATAGMSVAAGDYLMVGGQVQGSSTNTVYVMDQRRGVLVALAYDRSAKKLKAVGARSIASDSARSNPSR